MPLLRDIVVPIILILLLLTMSFISMSEWIVYSLIFFLYFLVIFQIGSWCRWSFYNRYLLIFIYFGSLLYSFIEVSTLPLFSGDSNDILFHVIIELIIILVLLYFAITIYMGRIYYEKPIHLDFPFKKGIYFIADGGGNNYVNHHIKGKYFVDNKINQSMTYAVDIQKITCLGTQSKALKPEHLEDYGCFGEKVFSPCDGEVVEVVNDVNDDFYCNYENPQGNHVIIRDGEIFITMLHFKKGSIKVIEGQYLKKGDFLGEAGNSGLVKKPNLHIQAVSGSPWFGEGVPILFEGKFLVKNDLVFKN